MRGVLYVACAFLLCLAVYTTVNKTPTIDADGFDRQGLANLIKGECQ